MREFELGPGGYTPCHDHSWPYIIYILEGAESLFLDGQDYVMEPGSFAFVPSNKLLSTLFKKKYNLYSRYRYFK